MSITHIVLFQFKESVSAEVVNDVCRRMLGLKDNCIHPSSQKPYIKSSSGGRDNSIEGAQNGISHAFVVEFASAADRDFYIEKDPVHLAFVRSLDGIIEKAQIIDYTPGVL
ncbi:hypothetical protein N7474_000813 [Penicillium riverlandense]|uniref:uncharacterized protein n=1 Tax=Penicillium riverlandense TaxID=1903569 RepID=UPI00254829B9|nr:uncharacterized protein N7474_000813 [Penicillium riverlandense]KAJ5832502.1 hypothetical protein N7474_000813 [Penicillium riverlandense]